MKFIPFLFLSGYEISKFVQYFIVKYMDYIIYISKFHRFITAPVGFEIQINKRGTYSSASPYSTTTLIFINCKLHSNKLPETIAYYFYHLQCLSAYSTM